LWKGKGYKVPKTDTSSDTARSWRVVSQHASRSPNSLRDQKPIICD